MDTSARLSWQEDAYGWLRLAVAGLFHVSVDSLLKDDLEINIPFNLEEEVACRLDSLR